MQAQWTAMQTGIPGDLRAVCFSTSRIMVAASSGAYFSSDDGATWETHPPSTAADSIVFMHSRINGIANKGSGAMHFAGEDTVAHTAVIFRHTFSTSVTELLYVGPPGSALNAISPSIAVGNNGLYLTWPGSVGPWTVRTPFTLQDLTCTAVKTGHYYVGGDSCLYHLTSPTGIPTALATGPWHDVACTGYSSNLALQNEDIHLFSGAPSDPLVYHPVPVQPTSACVFGVNGGQYVGTTNGILRGSHSTTTVLQYQPTADGYHVNDVVGTDVGIAYAACNDGWLLHTTNGGGDVMPYINFTAPNGGCVSQSLYFANHGTDASWLWKADGQNVSTNYSLNYTFNTTGTHTVTLIGTDGIYSDSASVTFLIVDPPPVANVSYTVSDTLFCQSGESTVTIAASDPAYRYRLYRQNDMAILDEALGTGAALPLHTGLLTDSCSLRIALVSALADCSTMVEDTIAFQVEHTRAFFHVGYLNADQGENAVMFNASEQAATYAWTFSNGATPATATAEDPTVAFSVTGPSEVILIATSAHGCSDTLALEGPYIHDPATLDQDCWAYRINTDVGMFFSYNDNFITSMAVSPANGDVYVAGTLTESVMEARSGRSFDQPYPGLGGYFLNRQDHTGTLRWCIYGYYLGLNGFDTQIAAAANGDIIAKLYGDLHFVDGQNPALSYFGGGHLLARIDSLGRLVWWSGITEDVMEIKVDASDNIYLRTGGCWDAQSLDRIYISPSSDTTNLGECRDLCRLIKLDPQGELLWSVEAGVTQQANNTGFRGLACDAAGNVVMSGYLEQHIWLLSTNGDSLYVPFVGGNFDRYGILVKYDPDGVLQWVNKPYGPSFGKSAMDGQGNIYTGVWSTFTDSLSFTSVNLPGEISITEEEVVLCSYSGAGDLRWIATSNVQTDYTSVECTAQDEVMVYGDLQVGLFEDYVTLGPAGQSAVDSIYTWARAAVLARWASNGDLQRFTTLTGDSCETDWDPILGGAIAISLMGDVFIGTNYYGIVAPPLEYPGGPVEAQDVHYTVLAHVNDLLCDPDPDIPTGKHPAPPVAGGANGVVVYPIPADRDLMVISPYSDAQMLRIIDARGRLAQEQRFAGRSITVDTSRLNAGPYSMVITGPHGSHVQRVVIMH